MKLKEIVLSYFCCKAVHLTLSKSSTVEYECQFDTRRSAGMVGLVEIGLIFWLDETAGLIKKYR